jgi:hypothetical protein
VHGTNKQKMIAWALHGSMEHQPETWENQCSLSRNLQ